MDFRRTALICILTVFAVASGTVANATQSVSLAWEPSAGSDVIGYRLEVGTASGTYTESVDVQNVTAATVSSLADGTTYYFAVTAYNNTNSESIPSNEV